MGKWSILKEHLPKFLGNDQHYEDKIIKLKASILTPVDPRERPLISSNELETIQMGLRNEMSRVMAFLQHHIGDRRFASAYAAAYRDARIIRDQLDEYSKFVGHYIEAYTQLLDAQLEAEDCASLKLDDGTSVRMQPEPFTTIEDKEKFNAWCRANGYESQMSLMWSTANAIVKERLENAEDDVPGVKLWWKNRVVLTKPKSSNMAVTHGEAVEADA